MRRRVALFLGNPIMGDDAIALRVYERILWAQDRLDMDMKTFEGAGFDLVEELRGYVGAVLVDAMSTGVYPPGEVVVMDVASLEDANHYSSIHTLNIPAVLEMARRCGYDVPEDITLVGIEVRSAHEFSECLTPELEGKLPAITDKILNVLKEKC